MKRLSRVAFAALAALTGASQAAEYRFVTDHADNHYDLSLGENVVKVYLQETGFPSQIAGIGLDGAAFSVTRQAPAGVKIADLVFNDAFDLGPPFNFKSIAADGSLASLNEASWIPVEFDAERPDCVYLGSIILAPDVGAGPAVFLIDRYGSGGDIITSQQAILDASPDMGVLITVAVPEPHGLMLVAAMGLLLQARGRRGSNRPDVRAIDGRTCECRQLGGRGIANALMAS